MSRCSSAAVVAIVAQCSLWWVEWPSEWLQVSAALADDVCHLLAKSVAPSAGAWNFHESSLNFHDFLHVMTPKTLSVGLSRMAPAI